ncbi:MAG TPA: hypothetical protein VGD84_15535, partial [Pseudonocardiaceae bacterium]
MGTTGPGGAGGGGGTGFVVGLTGTGAFPWVVTGIVVVGDVVEVGAEDDVTIDVGVDDPCVGPVWACGVPPA